MTLAFCGFVDGGMMLSFQRLEMLGETGIGFGDQCLVEALLRHARLVARNQNDGFAHRVERERRSPYTIGDGERSSFIFA